MRKLAPNQRKAGQERFFVGGEQSVTQGAIPGVGPVIRVAVADRQSGHEVELYYPISDALVLRRLLGEALRAELGVIAAEPD